MADDLATMKARIADEIARDDLESQIATAINDAIKFYQNHAFFFNESRTATVFNTVIGQDIYSSADNANIPYLYFIDYVVVNVGGTISTLTRTDPVEIEVENMAGTNNGEPTKYCYFDKKLRIGPIPSGVWSLRVSGKIRIAAPASDDEVGNAWMTDGEKLIRCRAKYELALHWTKDMEMAQTMTALVTETVDDLEAETANRAGTGMVRPFPF